jgi:hypothetical protein
MLQQKIEPDEEFKGLFKRQCINLAEALLQDNWNVDWTNGLSSAEIKIVCQHKTWFSYFAAVFFFKPRGFLACKKLFERRVILPVCSACKQVYCCTKSCQVMHWKKKHKKQCKLLQSGLNKDDPRDAVFSRDFDDTILSFHSLSCHKRGNECCMVGLGMTDR